MLMGGEDVKARIREMEESIRFIESITTIPLADRRNAYATRMAIVELVESAASLGLMLLRKRGFTDELEGYAAIFTRLADVGVVSREVGEGMARLARLRDLIVHRYWQVDDSRICKEARGNGLAVAKRFVEEVCKDNCRT